jgi:hypothetical protein
VAVAVASEEVGRKARVREGCSEGEVAKERLECAKTSSQTYTH